MIRAHRSPLLPFAPGAARALCGLLAVVLLLGATRAAFADSPGPSETQITATALESARFFSLPEDRQSRARLEARSAVQRFRLFRTPSAAARPSVAVRRYAVEVDRRPSFHCRLPVPRSAVEDPVPH